MTHLLEGERYSNLHATLRRWGATDEQATNMLQGSTFGDGLIGLKTGDATIGTPVGIRVDDSADQELAELFEWRAALDEDDYIEQWETDPAPMWRIMLDSDSPHALARCSITIRRPRNLTRRYLFVVKAMAPLLAEMQRPGTSVWLVPESFVQVESARHGPSSVYDAITRSLLLGRVDRPLASLDQALTHVGYTGSRPAGPNRAQRRADRHKKK